MTERSWDQIPTVKTIFHAPLIWIKTMKVVIVESYPGIVECAVIPQIGGWNLRTVGL
jgi:hypothetical protein